jgi:hypothetical protein
MARAGGADGGARPAAIPMGTRVRLKVRTIGGWKGEAVVIAYEGGLIEAIKEDNLDWTGIIICRREEISVVNEQWSLAADAVRRINSRGESVSGVIQAHGRLVLPRQQSSHQQDSGTCEMSRLFDKTTINVPGARPQPAYLIECSKCGETEKVTTSTNGKTMAPEGIAAKFRNIGWIVGSRHSHDICPKCQTKRESRYAPFTIKKQAELPVSEVTATIDAPREMSKADRRVILAKIEDVYLDETSGYRSGWSDQKVADDLGVPRAWVKMLREENFGSEGANEEVVKLLGEAKEVVACFKAQVDRYAEAKSSILASIERGDKEWFDLAGKIDSICGRIAKIEKQFK